MTEDTPRDRHHMNPVEHAAKRQADFDRERQRREEHELSQVKAALHRRYVSAAPGSTDADFETAFPGLLKRYREEQAIKPDAQDVATDHPYGDPKRWGLGR